MFKFLKKKSKINDHINGIYARSSNDLLKPYQHIITQIQQNVGVPQEHWQINYLDFINSFALKVQLLPASESHHHSSYGGLLEHSLETGLNALKLRRGKMLPVGASAEVIEREKEIWSYAIFTAALLHDVGKPLTDQIITLVSETPSRKFNPLTETLKEDNVYHLSFRRGRKYRSHENLPLLLAGNLVPKIGLNWITSNPDILDEWTLCLTGRKSEAESIGKLITKADQISTAQNLTGNTNFSTPATKATPLHKRIVTALTYLLDHDELPLNRKGAAGWVFDGKLWLVSKRVLDAVRVHMKKEGQTGIPSDNARIMDELTQHNIIKATDDDLAIWKMEVRVGSWKNQFTVLCFPLSNIWKNQTAWPLSPQDVLVSRIIKPKKDPTDKTLETQTNQDSPADIEHNENIETNSPPPQEMDLNLTSPPAIELDLPTPPGIKLLESSAKNSSVSANSYLHKMPSTKQEKVEPELKESSHTKEIKDNSCGNDFIDWMSNGIADGSITINQQQAMTHIIGENKDLILVSPKIFRVYGSKRNLDYKEVQRSFQLLGLHSQNGDLNIWPFKTLTKRSNKSEGQLNGMLVKNAEAKLNIKLPPPNSHITYSN